MEMVIWFEFMNILPFHSGQAILGPRAFQLANLNQLHLACRAN